jgi:hypothetical protein
VLVDLKGAVVAAIRVTKVDCQAAQSLRLFVFETEGKLLVHLVELCLVHNKVFGSPPLKLLKTFSVRKNL